MLDADTVYIPLDRWIQTAIEWIALHFRPAFRTVRWPIDELLNLIEGGLQATPPLLFIISNTPLPCAVKTSSPAAVPCMRKKPLTGAARNLTPASKVPRT